MKKLKSITLLFLLGLSIIGCSPSSSPVPTACSTVGTDFQNIYNTTLASNTLYDDYSTMDLVTHEYTLNMFVNKSICSIGYQGNANLFAASIPYTIEIEDITGVPFVVYSNNHVFNSAYTDYVVPTSTVNLIAGRTYKIKRIASNYLGNILNTTGRICRFNGAGLPVAGTITGSIMAITSSNFYGTGGPIPNFGIPYIDISFN